MNRLPVCSLIALFAVATSAHAADLSVSAADVLYDTTAGRLEITVRLADAAALAPFTVTLMALDPEDTAIMSESEKLYKAFWDAGIDCLQDFGRGSGFDRGHQLHTLRQLI